MKYDDIINLPHYEPKHPRMSMYARAAQFAPFAALTGYSDAVREEARLTNKRIILDEGYISLLNEKLKIIESNIKNHPEVTITYFLPDKKKQGGSYNDITGNVRRIDLYNNVIEMTNRNKISINEIIDIKSDVFKNMI